MKKCPWVLHPFLLAAFPVFYFYSTNFRTVGFAEILVPVGLSMGSAVAAYLILKNKPIRLDGPRAGLIVSAALVLFFSFSHGVRWIERAGLGRSRPSSEGLVLAIESVVLVGVIGLVFNRPTFCRWLNGPGNASSIGLVALTALGLVHSEWGEPAPVVARIDPPIAPGPAPPSGRRPDVYLIILDAFGRSDVLRERHGLDNSAMVERLEARGFVVGRSSRSNYCQTVLSLAATLNLRYLDDLAGNAGDDRRPIRRLIADNLTFRSFRDAGYRLVGFASGFDATESFELDLTLEPAYNLRTFSALVANQTPLWILMGQRGVRDPFHLHRERILKTFDELPADSHPSDRPSFTFAHILSPHPPFVFKADGEDSSEVEATYSQSDSDGWYKVEGHGGPEDYSRRYRDQAAYLSSRIAEVVDRILATSSNPPIIIIQGDHGPGSCFDSVADYPNDVFERFGIFNACLVPEGFRGEIVPEITPINTLRVAVDAALATKLGRLEDRSFYSSYAKPYRFIEVTDVPR